MGFRGLGFWGVGVWGLGACRVSYKSSYRGYRDDVGIILQGLGLEGWGCRALTEFRILRILSFCAFGSRALGSRVGGVRV